MEEEKDNLSVSENEEITDTTDTDTEKDLIFEKKRYSITYEMFDNAYTVFQSKYVYPRNYILCVVLALAAVGNILNIVLGNSSYLSYILVAACLALAAINLYNPKKIKRNLMESIRGIENDVYTLEVHPDKLVIGTVIDPVEQNDSEPEEYEEVFGETVKQEHIQDTEIYINNTLRVTERADYFMIYIKKSMFYVVPKSALSQEEIRTFALYFSERIGKYFSCEADK